MANRKPQPSTTPPDPLADLREPDAPGLPGGPAVPVNSEPGQAGPEQKAPEEPVVELRPMVSGETHEELVAATVAAWHLDPTSLGFLHGGGSMCGCWYIARLGLRAAVPIMTEEDLEERELEPSDG